VEKGKNTVVLLPDNLKGKNMVIEIGSSNIQRFKTFYSSTLKVKVNEQLGELKVFNGLNNKPLSKTYVKVFCKTDDGKEMFYRDGFTDIRGKFEYAQASGGNLKKVAKFAILASHEKHGQIIKELERPKLQE
jgi:hypothetical protein